jgi:hypothetical protein
MALGLLGAAAKRRRSSREQDNGKETI